MDKIILSVDTRRFLVINTTNYNNDNNAMVQIADIDGCMNLGWNPDETNFNIRSNSQRFIDEMQVGDVLESNDFNGAYLMRIA